MSLQVSKDCFPVPTKCHNCVRKMTEMFKEDANPKEEYKRCAGCHLMTYCDKDCQKEHWIRVHKNHCRFLSGKTPVNNSQHNATTCARCIQEREASHTQIASENSPKTSCDIKATDESIKRCLSVAFTFHQEGKSCKCALEFGLELPFPLGEVSGQYIDIGNTGLDAMLAHAHKILSAMFVKAKEEDHRIAVCKVWFSIIMERAQLWLDILISGKPRVGGLTSPLSDKVDNLKIIYKESNVWWKILRFSVDFIINSGAVNKASFYDFPSLEDPRFEKLKLIHSYYRSQLQNRVTVTEKKMWLNFMLWPQLVNGSLAVFLPHGTRCQSCNAQLTGQVAIRAHEFSPIKSLPFLFPEVGDNGALMASCSRSRCVMVCINKNVEGQLQMDDDHWKECLEKDKLFCIESRECDFCLRSSLSSHRCSACLAVQYCSPVCQKKDLDFHATVCSTWANDNTRRIQGKKKQKEHWKSVLHNK